MIHVVDRALRDEIARYRLAFSCDRCAQYDPESDRCSLGYPVAPHRRSDVEAMSELVFCKHFELW